MADIDDLRIDHSLKQRGTGWRAAFFALLICILAGGAAAVYFWFGARANAVSKSARSNSPAANEYAPPPPAPSAPAGFTAAGYVEVVPPGARIIAPLVAGRVQEIVVREGQSIARNDRIATLDPTLLERQLHQAEARSAVLHARLARLEAGYLQEEIEQSKARMAAAQAALQFAIDHAERTRKLVESDAASRRALLEAEARVADASAAHLEAEADLRIKQLGARPEDIAITLAEIAQAELERDHIAWKIEQCVIRAPVDAIVFQQFAQPGQWISPDESPAGGAIVSLFTPGPGALQAWVDVNQRDIGRVQLGQRVTMVADAAPERRIEGEVIQFMPRASIERNTVRVKITIEGEHEHLRPDMSLRVTFHEPKPRQSASDAPRP